MTPTATTSDYTRAAELRGGDFDDVHTARDWWRWMACAGEALRSVAAAEPDDAARAYALASIICAASRDLPTANGRRALERTLDAISNRSFSSYCYLTFRDVPPVTGAGCRWLLGR